MKALVFLLILVLWVLLCSSTAGAEAPTTNQGTVLYFPLLAYAEPGKAGVGSPYSDCAHINALGATWYQDWSAWPPLCDEWSRPLAMVGSWHGGALPEIAPYAWAVQLGNEPNLPAQGNMTVAETAELCRLAADRWPDVPKISPATYDDAYYLFQAYELHERTYGVPPDWQYIGVHCYFDTAQGCRDYIDLLRPLADNYDPPLPFLVTEWAILPCSVTTAGVRGQPDITRAQAEAATLRAWFEAQPDIAAHLWFASEYEGDEWCVWKPHPACDTALMRDGRLTAWGEWWLR